MPSYTRYRDQLLLLKDYIINLTVLENNVRENFIVRYVEDHAERNESCFIFHDIIATRELKVEESHIHSMKPLCVFTANKAKDIYNDYCNIVTSKDVEDIKLAFFDPECDTLSIYKILQFKEKYNPTFKLTKDFLYPNKIPIVEALMCIMFGLHTIEQLDQEIYAYNSAKILADIIKKHAVSQALHLFPDSAEERALYIADIEKRTSEEDDEEIVSLFEIKTPREIYYKGWPPLYSFDPIYDVAITT